MNHFSGIARLRSTACFVAAPLPEQTFELSKRPSGYRIAITDSHGQLNKRWHIDVPAAEVEHQLELLRHATVPAYPVSDQVCDGEYVELWIQGECAQSNFGWYTAVPHGAEALGAFADWMRKRGGRDDRRRARQVGLQAQRLCLADRSAGRLF